MELQEMVLSKAKAAKEASYGLAGLSSNIKNEALCAMADMLERRSTVVLEANEKDFIEAKESGMRRSYLDRLMLNEIRVKGMADALRHAASLSDPVGEVDYSTVRPNGLEIRSVRVPIGVVGMIYEARPNVTSDAVGLCIKSGNSIVLRGGSDCLRSNKAIVELLQEAAYKNGIPDGAIQLIDVKEREAVEVMTHLNGYLDVIVPRGGAGLIKAVVGNSSVPVIETGTGVCHTFVDETADLHMAMEIAINAKISRPSVCNAMETLLVHDSVAEYFLPMLAGTMSEHKCELRGCEKALSIVPNMIPATEDDWSEEYGDLILSIKVVKDISEAIKHINKYGTGHSEAIVTENLLNAHRFQWDVNAAVVYVNASTRFSDGGEFGFGAELGISTQKLHARGPMGLRALTTNKYMIYGEGHVR